MGSLTALDIIVLTLVGVEIEDDRAPAQRGALADPVARIGERQMVGRRDRERQYVAIVKRGAHDASASAASASASRASARRSAITLLMALLVALSAG